ncbi:MAG: hypothetical protein Q8K32_22760 [Archangium sp.]|nr:hypothetical protein [Archangium sp.]
MVELWATPAAIGEQAARLADEPVRALTIENADIAGVAALSLREPFRNLRQLSVEANGLSGDLVATLVERLHSPRLHSLSLSRVALEGTGLKWRKVLAGAARLERLELTGCFTSGDAAAAFLREARLPRVRRLRLADNGLGHGVEAIALELRRSGRRSSSSGWGQMRSMAPRCAGCSTACDSRSCGSPRIRSGPKACAASRARSRHGPFGRSAWRVVSWATRARAR